MNFPKIVLLAALALTTPSAWAITYDAWIASFGLTGADALPTADPDGDGLPNLMEYALDCGTPTSAPDQTAMSALPTLGFAARTGNALGQWDWKTAATQAGSVWHYALRYRPRPGVEGIRYQPELSHDLANGSWYSGRAAFINQSYPGNIVQSTAIAQGQAYQRYFMRLRVSQDATVGSNLSGITAGGITQQALNVGTPNAVLRATSATTTTNVQEQDRLITRTTGAATITDYRWDWAANANNLEALGTVQRTSSDPAVIVPDPADPYKWTAVAPGTATLRLSTTSNNYEASVTVSTATGGTTDTVTGFAPGSLRAHIIAQVDPLIVGATAATALPIYTTQDHATPAYVRNTACWAYPHTAALTAISPWNSQGGAQFAGVLISPRHVLFATHFTPSAGATLRFVAADNTLVTRTLSAVQAVTVTSSLYPDLTVGVLDSDVPASISYARVLPDNWANYLPALNTTEPRLPVIGLDQEEKALIADLTTINTSGNLMVTMNTPAAANRRALYEGLIGGDSGNPGALLINGQLVLLTCWTYPWSGTFTTGQRTAINAIMTSQGGGYQLTDADLSTFPTY